MTATPLLAWAISPWWQPPIIIWIALELSLFALAIPRLRQAQCKTFDYIALGAAFLFAHIAIEYHTAHRLIREWERRITAAATDPAATPASGESLGIEQAFHSRPFTYHLAGELDPVDVRKQLGMSESCARLLAGQAPQQTKIDVHHLWDRDTGGVALWRCFLGPWTDASVPQHHYLLGLAFAQDAVLQLQRELGATARLSPIGNYLSQYCKPIKLLEAPELAKIKIAWAYDLEQRAQLENTIRYLKHRAQADLVTHGYAARFAAVLKDEVERLQLEHCITNSTQAPIEFRLHGALTHDVLRCLIQHDTTRGLEGDIISKKRCPEADGDDVTVNELRERDNNILLLKELRTAIANDTQALLCKFSSRETAPYSRGLPAFLRDCQVWKKSFDPARTWAKDRKAVLPTIADLQDLATLRRCTTQELLSEVQLHLEVALPKKGYQATLSFEHLAPGELNATTSTYGRQLERSVLEVNRTLTDANVNMQGGKTTFMHGALCECRTSASEVLVNALLEVDAPLDKNATTSTQENAIARVRHFGDVVAGLKLLDKEFDDLTQLVVKPLPPNNQTSPGAQPFEQPPPCDWSATKIDDWRKQVMDKAATHLVTALAADGGGETLEGGKREIIVKPVGSELSFGEILAGDRAPLAAEVRLLGARQDYKLWAKVMPLQRPTRGNTVAISYEDATDFARFDKLILEAWTVQLYGVRSYAARNQVNRAPIDPCLYTEEEAIAELVTAAMRLLACDTYHRANTRMHQMAFNNEIQARAGLELISIENFPHPASNLSPNMRAQYVKPNRDRNKWDALLGRGRTYRAPTPLLADSLPFSVRAGAIHPKIAISLGLEHEWNQVLPWNNVPDGSYRNRVLERLALIEKAKTAIETYNSVGEKASPSTLNLNLRGDELTHTRIPSKIGWPLLSVTSEFSLNPALDDSSIQETINHLTILVEFATNIYKTEALRQIARDQDLLTLQAEVFRCFELAHMPYGSSTSADDPMPLLALYQNPVVQKQIVATNLPLPRELFESLKSFDYDLSPPDGKANVKPEQTVIQTSLEAIRRIAFMYGISDTSALRALIGNTEIDDINIERAISNLERNIAKDREHRANNAKPDAPPNAVAPNNLPPTQ